MGLHLENCVLSDRTPEDFLKAIQYAWRGYQRLSDNAANTMICEGWDWQDRSEYFFALFRRLIDHGPDNVKPFSYLDTAVEEI